MDCFPTQMVILQMILDNSSGNIKLKYRETTEDKIKNCVFGGYHKLQVVADFDATLTKSIVNGKPAAHSFDVLARVGTLSAAYREGCAALAARYGPQLESAAVDSERHQVLVDWWNDHEALCAGELAPVAEIQKATDEVGTPLRDGCEGMMNFLTSRSVPLTVVSAGVGQVVEYQLRNVMTKIVSNFINLDEDNRILSFKPPLVSVYNKHKIKLPVNEQRINIIVLGDSLGDSKMADSIPNAKTILKIGFFTGEDQNSLDSFLNVYDIVVINDQTMHVVLELLKLIENQQDVT